MASEEKCFTFTWKLENASYCVQKKGQFIKSPAFVVDEIHEAKWKLWLYPRGATEGNLVGFFLHREWDSKGADKVEIKYELAFLAKNGSAMKSYLVTHSFPKNQGFGFNSFVKREDVFILKRSTYLPKDTLTARCRIWKSSGKMDKDVRCFACTRIGIEKRTFLWKIKNFSKYEPEEEETYLLKSILNGMKLMSVDLSLGGGQNIEEIIHFEVTCDDKSVEYCALKLSIVKCDKTPTRCHQDEFWVDKLSDSHNFTFHFSRQMLMENLKKLEYLPDDILSLKWECVFSKGIFSEEIVEVVHG